MWHWIGLWLAAQLPVGIMVGRALRARAVEVEQ